jgi:pyridoxine kinase
MKTPSILSIQSSVVSGRVGNSAAVPIHSLFEQETLRVDSVVLAAHPGIMRATKFIPPIEQMRCLLQELRDVKPSSEINAIQTGYLGEIEQVNVILSFITDHPNSLYVYDPVFGDNGALYVDSLIAEKSKSTLLPLATITTPNMFELSYLSQMEVSGIDSAIKASKIIKSNGPEWVLSTGIYSGETEIADILVTPNDVRIFSHKRQHTGVSGAGDTLTAILTSLLVSGEPLENAARKACTITQSLIGLSNSPQSMPPLTLDLIRK